MSNHIAFIGVGNMGNPMAQQLVKAGQNVKVFDVSPDVIEIAKQSGLNVISSMEELLQGATTVISMLPEGKHVRSLYLGDNGILKKIPKDCLIIDCSTIDIETSLALGSEAKKIGINMIDAPVTGGVMGARIGRLNFLVGGTDEAVALAKATASSVPPTKKFSLPILAPITPPVTGASIILIPIFFASLPRANDVSISIVEQSIIKQSFGIFFNIPLSPK